MAVDVVKSSAPLAGKASTLIRSKISRSPDWEVAQLVYNMATLWLQISSHCWAAHQVYGMLRNRGMVEIGGRI